MTPTIEPAPASLAPKTGEVVQVRHRRYLVEDVTPPHRPGDAHAVRLSCLDDDAQGQPLAVLWEAEPDAQVLTATGWKNLATRGFDSPEVFSAYLHTLRWNCVTATNPKLFQSPFRSGIQLHVYQLDPLRKALLLPRVNLFIADDVGLGKTIEAGLIVRELLMRKKVRDVVVSCPPSVLTQWRDELDTRFGLRFEILDKEYIQRVRRDRGYATNPWATHSRFLISHRLLIDETYTSPLRDWLGPLRPGSMLILDECHHAAPASGSKYAIDSKITRAIRDLAPRFEHRLFLSATPHNGHSNSFSALLEILDPQRFCRGVPVKAKSVLDAVMVRRLKEDIREAGFEFPKREVVQLGLDGLPPNTPELVLAELLDRYRQALEARLAGESKRRQGVAILLVSGLQQRLFSSIEAFARTLRVHRRTVERQQLAAVVPKPRPSSGSLLDLLGSGPDADDDRATCEVDDLARDEDAQFEAATTATGVSAAPDLTGLLAEMSDRAEAARGRPDARVKRFLQWVRDHLCPAVVVPGEPTPIGAATAWADRRVIVFTEYEDTLRYLRCQIEVAIEATDLGPDRVEVYRGPTPADERETIKRAFNSDPKKHPIRILLCTDAAREGLNLQTHCADLFHFDLPWNPSRMEQRNGRIDRKLQPSPEVRCHYFVYHQRPEDRVLQALVRKTDTIRKELGSLSRVIDGRLAEALAHGIRRADLSALERVVDRADQDTEAQAVVDEELEAVRDRQSALNATLAELRAGLDESKAWVGMDAGHFRQAISCALRMLGADDLKPDPTNPALFTFPALDRRDGGDPTWADTLDGLRGPREKGQTLWDWRRASALRPVTFAELRTMTDEVVQLHLEHSVVRRLLGRFTAQEFVHNDLARACVTHTADAYQRVALIGRLCLYGAGAARLHEELIAVTAIWMPLDQRKGKPLAAQPREGEGETLRVLEAALGIVGPPVNEIVQTILKSAGPYDVADLIPQLQKRADEAADRAERQLTRRGAEEAKQMQKILEDQKKRITATAEKQQDVRVGFGWADDELKQLEADRKHWNARLAALEKEIENEPMRVREVYEVKARRVEPVGLVYLWPVTG